MKLGLRGPLIFSDISPLSMCEIQHLQAARRIYRGSSTNISGNLKKYRTTESVNKNIVQDLWPGILWSRHQTEKDYLSLFHKWHKQGNSLTCTHCGAQSAIFLIRGFFLLSLFHNFTYIYACVPLNPNCSIGNLFNMLIL